MNVHGVHLWVGMCVMEPKGVVGHRNEEDWGVQVIVVGRDWNMLCVMLCT